MLYVWWILMVFHMLNWHSDAFFYTSFTMGFLSPTWTVRLRKAKSVKIVEKLSARSYGRDIRTGSMIWGRSSVMSALSKWLAKKSFRITRFVTLIILQIFMVLRRHFKVKLRVQVHMKPSQPWSLEKAALEVSVSVHPSVSFDKTRPMVQLCQALR